jgi:hypothetical protein
MMNPLENFFIPVFQARPAESDNGLALFGWLLAFALAMAVMLFVGQPLLQLETGKRRVRQISDAQVELETLKEKAAAEKLSLEELEFDRELGIIDDADYETLKGRSNGRLAILEKALFEREEEIAESERELASRRKARTAARSTASQENGKTTAARPVSNGNGETKLKQSVKDTLKCSECDKDFKPGETFCEQCQAPLPVICLNCGAEVKEEEARFCSRCGTTIESRRNE